MPVPVQKTFGTGLRDAQYGETPDIAKRLSGFGGGSVLELVEDHRRTYRAVYTVSMPEAVYVLHAFQKKSKRGIRTPHEDVELIRRRLRIAARHHEESRRGENIGG